MQSHLKKLFAFLIGVILIGAIEKYAFSILFTAIGWTILVSCMTLFGAVLWKRDLQGWVMRLKRILIGDASRTSVFADDLSRLISLSQYVLNNWHQRHSRGTRWVNLLEHPDQIQMLRILERLGIPYPAYNASYDEWKNYLTSLVAYSKDGDFTNIANLLPDPQRPPERYRIDRELQARAIASRIHAAVEEARLNEFFLPREVNEVLEMENARLFISSHQYENLKGSTEYFMKSNQRAGAYELFERF